MTLNKKIFQLLERSHQEMQEMKKLTDLLNEDSTIFKEPVSPDTLRNIDLRIVLSEIDALDRGANMMGNLIENVHRSSQTCIAVDFV